VQQWLPTRVRSALIAGVIAITTLLSPSAAAGAEDLVDCAGASPCGRFDVAGELTYAWAWTKHADDHNPHFANFTGAGGNCTNFVSQVLYAGGMGFMREFGHGSGAWWYRDALGAPGSGRTYPYTTRFERYPLTLEFTASFMNADELPRHLYEYGLADVVSNDPRQWRPGDLIFENFFSARQQEYDHAQVVFAVRGGQPIIAQQSGDRTYHDLGWAAVSKLLTLQHGPQGRGWDLVVLRPLYKWANVGAIRRDRNRL
jgi:hypothetical protein